MKFKQYIKEEEEIYDLEKIKKECSKCVKYIKETGHFLYRSFQKLSGPELSKIQKKKTHKERCPVDTSYSAHEILDEWFLENFGWKARSNYVMFCYGRLKSKKSSMVLVPNGFSFIYSPIVDDLTDYLDLYHFNGSNKELREMLKDDMNLLKYTDKNFQKALRSGNEIMIKTKYYYYIPEIYWEDIWK
jgi:hypothetical protein